MSGDDKIAALVFLPVLLVILCSAVAIGFHYGDRFARFEAVENGSAHWEADPLTGSREFIWHQNHEVRP